MYCPNVLTRSRFTSSVGVQRERTGSIVDFNDDDGTHNRLLEAPMGSVSAGSRC